MAGSRGIPPVMVIEHLAPGDSFPFNSVVRSKENGSDVLIIGGGPGGSTAANVLARAGRRVTLLEKEKFPRFHVGESLLPYNQTLFRRLGVIESLAEAGFPVKRGAQFHLGNGLASTRFDFSEGRFTREKQTVQVERARFDEILLDRARQAGAEVREGWTVKRFATTAEGVRLEATDPAGSRCELAARFLIDASGRANVTANQEGLRMLHPRHRKVAVFAHFLGVHRDAGEAGGDTVIVRLENRWFWLIPVSDRKTSVGLVMDPGELSGGPEGAEAAFTRCVQSSPVLRRFMDNAERASPMHTTGDFSYFNQRLVGHRLIRVGDAAGFLDPIFSSGVFLAMWSGELAADTVAGALTEGVPRRGPFEDYEVRMRRVTRRYWRMVEAYYTWPFMELFLQPRRRFDLPAAVNALLAGELEPGWNIRWRLALFFLLVRIQSIWPLVPRLSAGPPP